LSLVRSASVRCCMKCSHILLAAVLFYPGIACVVAEEGTDPVDLHAVEATVGQLLEQDHYTQRKLDAKVAKQILETYLESLDYNKLFFTQEDIDQISNEYGAGLDDDILLGNLTPAKNIYEIFKQRVDQRLAKINGLLTQRYNFDSNRAVTANRAKEPWPANGSVADGVWKDWIQKELLEEKLSASPPASGPEILGRQYRDLQNEIDHQDDEDVLRIFLEAVAHTYDAHSDYLRPSELNEFNIDTRLTVSGIGVQIRMENGYATVSRIFPGGPAERSGKLHVGDKIVGVAHADGSFVNIVHKDMDRFTEMVVGKDGSVLRLQLSSGKTKDPSKPRVVTLVRREVRLTEEEAQAQLIERPTAGGNVEKLGWITVPSFYGESDSSSKATSVTDDVALLLKRLEREGVQGVVVDLRNNAGGSVDEAARMSSLFINRGPIAQLKDPSGAIHLLEGQPGKPVYNGPLVLLDNKLTASASEIFSAALQDYGRAVIVGDSSSFGKGTVQTVVELNSLLHRADDPANSAGALKITIEKIYRVTGESTQLKGVTSDITLPSLTDSTEFGEGQHEHPLGYDEVAPTAINVAGNHKPLLLDDLRRRSVKRTNEDPLFHDLSVEIHQIKQKLSNNCVPLNEEVRRKEIAEGASLRAKSDSDRITASAHDRTKYYSLMLADVDKPELKLIKTKTELATAGKGAVPNETAYNSKNLLPGERDFGTAAENDAIRRETLNILSDLVSLKRTPLMATNERNR
jgi:carboxyl-terminal processing protease